MSHLSEKIPVGVSQCLLGDRVRYDGGHKHSPCITDLLSAYFDFRPFCPEVAIGLGVPRSPIRLVATDGDVRVKSLADPTLDVTDPLMAEADQAAKIELYGYVFMQKSPSCGLGHLKRYSHEGRLLDAAGQGIFAQRLTQRIPALPVEEAGALENPKRREAFVARVQAYWRRSQSDRWAPAGQKQGEPPGA